jgi:replicative DNA helicase
MNDMPEPTNPLQPGSASAYELSMEARVAVLEEIARNTTKVLERIEATIAKIDERMVSLEERMDKRMKELEDRLTSRMDRIEDRQTGDFRWMLGLGIGFGGFLWASMAHGFHWF